MEFQTILFYAFSVILVISAGAVVTVKNPVYAALCLVLAFFTSAAIWLLLEAEFLAISLVLVYVGAVLVLFLFVVMMLDINVDKLREGFARYLPAGVVVGLIILAQLALVLGPSQFGASKVAEPVKHAADYSNTKEIGGVLYTEYFYAFELAAAILLVAIVAAIVLTLRRRPGTKAQSVDKQVRVRRQDRIRMIKMAPETQRAAEEKQE